MLTLYPGLENPQELNIVDSLVVQTGLQETHE